MGEAHVSEMACLDAIAAFKGRGGRGIAGWPVHISHTMPRSHQEKAAESRKVDPFVLTWRSA